MAAKSMRILLLIAPKDYGGSGGKLSGGADGGQSHDPGVGQETGQFVGREGGCMEMEWAVAAAASGEGLSDGPGQLGRQDGRRRG